MGNRQVACLMRAAAIVVSVLCIPVANAGTDIGLTIHSIKVPPISSDEAKISITYGYDGNAGALNAAAVAGSGIDWELVSYGNRPFTLSTGENQEVTVSIIRPVNMEQMRTERIAIDVYRNGGFSIAKKVVNQQIEWAAVKSMQSYDRYRSRAALDLLSVGDFEELDRVVTYWTKEGRVSAHGDWKIDDFHYGVDRLLNYEKDRSRILSLIQAWRKTNPKSPSAAMADAIYWIQYASKLQGYLAPGKVPDKDTLMVMRQYHERADKILASSKTFCANNPFWYRLRLMSAINARKGDKAITSAFNDAVRAFPTYETPYIDMAVYLIKGAPSPRWEEAMQLANSMDEKLHKESPGAYADLLDHINDEVANTVSDLFTTGIASWPRTRDSWRALIAKYPTHYNLNRYAVAACQAGDRESMQTAFGLIGNQIATSAWRNNLSADLCRSRFMKKL